ncbi:MAG: flagellar hook-length control protein FliK [Burkholderiales bacterium]|nr:flagellar hook-length control protein FliK [Burkholderiales bacterium]
MQATQAVKNTPKDILSHATAQISGDGVNFKALLASEIAGAPSDAAPADPKAVKISKDSDPVKALKAADNGAAPQIIAMPILPPVKADVTVQVKNGDSPLNVQPAIPKNPAISIPLQADPSIPDNAPPSKIHADATPPSKIRADATLPSKIHADATLPSKTLPDSALPTAAASAPGALPAVSVTAGTVKPADIALTGNILPHSAVKEASIMVEKPVLPETHKISENQITQVVLPQANTAHQPAPAKLTVDAPVASPSWGTEVGQKIAWMSASDQHVAELHLNPPNLGPMEVKLTVHNDQATIQFVSNHHEVRAALESALPRLREMMMDNGITLGNASVGSGAFQQSAFSQQEHPRQQYTGGSLQQSASPALRISRLIGKVDTFA